MTNHRPSRLAAIALALGVISITGTAYAQPSITRGRAIIQRNCAQCHAVGASGDAPIRTRRVSASFPSAIRLKC